MPLLALLLCSSALVAVGYAWTDASSAKNTGNVISGEGLTAGFYKVDDTDAALTSGQFATGEKAWILVSDNVDGTPDYRIVSYEDVVIGKAALKIKAENQQSNSVKVWYTIDWANGEGDTYCNVSSDSNMDNPKKLELSESINVELDNGEATLYIELIGSDVKPYVEQDGDPKDADKSTPTFDITFYVELADQ